MKRALLVMDLVQVYIYGDKPLIPLETRNELINNIKKAIDLARRKKIPIIYVNSSFRRSDPIYKKYISYREQAMKGEINSQIIKEIKPKPTDFVLKKRGFDGFWKSGLKKLLEKLKINEIYLTGIQTDCCIRETAVTAAHLGYDVYIISDCCQTNREFGQVAALRFLKICTRGIITLKELPAYLKEK